MPKANAAANPHFSFPPARLRELVGDALAYGRRKGASAMEAEVSEGFGQSVTVRHGAVETIEYNRDKGLGVTVYLGQRKGYASTSDLSATALRETVDAALAIARFTAPDPCAGLPDEKLLARQHRDLDLYHPWALDVDAAADIARRCERAAFDLGPAVTNSEGATVSTQEGQFFTANSLGFEGGYPTSRHYVSVSVIVGERDGMQRDDWYSTARDAGDLASPESIGDYAARRALARQGARKIRTGQMPVIFEAPIASGLISNFVHAASGGSLYRKASFLVDRLDTPVFAPQINIVERPFLKKGLASGTFDNDGVATQDRTVVANGVLKGYFLSTYTSRKLGMQTTGNAGGCHNLIVEPGTQSLDELIREMGRGLLITELLGHGVNYVNGDYSRGAAGYWVEGGRISHPVEEITIAGNLRDMFMGIAAVGSDTLVRGSKQCGSILIDRMTVAGS
jgi:PmbA protein